MMARAAVFAVVAVLWLAASGCGSSDGAGPTSTSQGTSPTTVDAAETPEEFARLYASALGSGDAEFVWERLHRSVKEGFGEDLCRRWVEREIMQLVDYTLLSVNTGPLAKQLTMPTGSVTVADLYDVTVSFTFQGELFVTDSDFGLVGSEMYWLGTCT